MQRMIDELTRTHQALFGADLRQLPPAQVRSHLQAGREDLILVFEREEGPHSIVLGRLQGERVPYFDPESGQQEMPLADLMSRVESGRAVCLEKA